MRIVPAIDIIDGQCVRLTEGDYGTTKVYYRDPLEAAQAFEEAGLTHLHLVDLDGARQRKVVNWAILERIAANTGLSIDFSGGIGSADDVKRALDSGAVQVAIGSLAVRESGQVHRWLKEFGPETMVIGADVRSGRIATHGWQETTDKEVVEFIEDYRKAGAVYFLCTEISRDGKLAGPATELYRQILDQVPGIHLVASGGVSSLADLTALSDAGCGSAIVGKAIYEGRISLPDLAAFDHSSSNKAGC